MRTVRDADGRRYLLVKRSDQSSLVRDPESGAERYLENDRIEPVEGESPLETAASGVPDPVRRVVTAAHDDRSLGLLVALSDDGPRPVVGLLDAFDLCESDLHGLLAEFRAAGLVEEAETPGGRGYAATETTERAVALLRDDGDP
ncbi:hypothetical protein GCM10027435_08780 [Haloparvum alkalitolerans]|uniref:DUF7346 family protein n=1 Tax=Haloparvum alkalitolerans TaxID=1042953 RepID=UPI003CF329CC